MSTELVFEFVPDTVSPIELVLGETSESPVILPFLIDTMFST